MSKSANAGELRTPVFFKRVLKSVDKDAVKKTTEENIFGEGYAIKVKWVNAHGSDAFIALQMKLSEPATITCRYSPKINVDQLIYRGSDPKPYEIISIDNVEERNQWLEIKVKRKVQAR